MNPELENQFDFALSKVLQVLAALASWAGPWLIQRRLVERTANLQVPGGPSLDILRPRGVTEPLPVVLLIHGGGFRFYSKESHSGVANRLAKLGHVVVNTNYGLAPQRPYPEGLIDVIYSYLWTVKEIAAWGGDPTRVSVVGESVGANLALALALWSQGLGTLPRTGRAEPEVPAPLFVPKKLVLHCGLFEVSHSERLVLKSCWSHLVRSRIRQIDRHYLKTARASDWNESQMLLAQPIRLLEKLLREETHLPVSFPKIFIPVGEQDSIFADSQRLQETLSKLGHPSTLQIYPGQGHAFYVKLWGKQVRACWHDIAWFLDPTS